MISTADRLRQEGRIEGKIEGRIEGEIKGKIEGKIEGEIKGIEAMLEIKFGARGLSKMKKIRQIKDLEKLNKIFQDAKTLDIESFEKNLESYL